MAPLSNCRFQLKMSAENVVGRRRWHYEVNVIHEGYSFVINHDEVHVDAPDPACALTSTCTTACSRANGTCTLIKARALNVADDDVDVDDQDCPHFNVLIDTLSPWDCKVILKGLGEYGLKCSDIGHVVCTHGHVDHVGNLNLFTTTSRSKAGQVMQDTQIIVGHNIVSNGDHYYEHPFDKGVPYRINGDENVYVIATPGHTATCVSVIVRADQPPGIVAIVGDLFEREEDIWKPCLWCDEAGSENPTLQRQNRSRVAHLADYIVPGHGPMFKVTDQIRQQLDRELKQH